MLSERLRTGRLEFEEGAVEEEKGVVWCRGEGEFTVLRTGKSWRESIAYRLRWTQQEGRLVLVEWEIWAGASECFRLKRWELTRDADTLGAFLASVQDR